MAVSPNTLRELLSSASAYLFAALNLAGVRDHMVDSRDQALVSGQLQVVASGAKGPFDIALQSAEDIVTKTKRPGVAAEASKIADFITQTQSAFSACSIEPGG